MSAAATASSATGFGASLARAKRLWRHNFRILLGTGYWILVLPVAASQVVTLWMFALSTEFSQEIATRIAEQLTPILAAFLVAHSLAPEYKSGVGAVLACKPLSLHRVLTARVGLAAGFALALTSITLGVCSVGLKPIEMAPPLLSAIPSVWFLSMLALTFATLFRNALGGFAVAAGVWAVEFSMGYGVHPFLSLSGQSAFLGKDPLAAMWIWSKVTLLVVGVILAVVHGRLLPRICRPPAGKDLPRMALAAGLTVLVYCATGAAAVVGYAYFNRTNLAIPDVTWLQRQFRVYGPVPVSQCFGPAFAAYVAETPAGTDGAPATNQRRTQLEQAAQKWPKSLWADGILFALAADYDRSDGMKSVETYNAVADRHPKSPFAPRALVRIMFIESDAVTQEPRLAAARRLLADYANRPEAERAAVVMEGIPEVAADEKLKAAEIASRVAPAFRRPAWLVTLAEHQKEKGEGEAAKASARSAREEALKLMELHRARAGSSDLAPHMPQISQALQDADRLLKAP